MILLCSSSLCHLTLRWPNPNPLVEVQVEGGRAMRMRTRVCGLWGSSLKMIKSFRVLLFVCAASLAAILTLRPRKELNLRLHPNNTNYLSSSSPLTNQRRLARLTPAPAPSKPYRYPASVLPRWQQFFKGNDPRTVAVKDGTPYSSTPHVIKGPLRICERLAPLPHKEDTRIMQKYASACPINNQSPEETAILLLEGIQTFGRTGNNLIEFLHALQYAKDARAIVGIVQGSWPVHLITPMWMAIQDEPSTSRHSERRAEAMAQWIEFVEQAFCVKIIVNEGDLLRYKEVIRMETKELFLFQHDFHDGKLDEYIEYQGHIIRTLFRSYNRGIGVDMRNRPVRDMCSVLDAIFGDEKHSTKYTVIHSRSLEGDPGVRLLARIARNSGCDPMAALDMEPDYIKAILKPLGMLEYPILFITDHQRPEILEKLKADPDIGPNIHLIPDEASWVGSDITLAIMSDVFIGNPASSFSGFIAKSRVALGYDRNFLFRKKINNGEWVDVCDHRCIFDKTVMNAMA